MKLLLAEWHTLNFDLDLPTLDVLELQRDLLLHLAIGDGNDAILGKNAMTIVAGRPSIELRWVGDGGVLVLLRCGDQRPDVHLSLPHPVVGAECVLVEYLMSRGTTSIL
jgi:hypothetical protein